MEPAQRLCRTRWLYDHQLTSSAAPGDSDEFGGRPLPMVEKLSRKGASMTRATMWSRTRAPDYDAIVRVVHLYSDAFGANDVRMFEEAFHKDAWIFYTGEEGSLTNCPIRDCFEGWALPAMGRAIGRVISVIQAGDIATVLLGWDRPDDMANSYVDMHNLIRLDGVWKITNKTATHTSRAGGA
jgi:hypothetical protein